jgi:hypothetical protein
MSWCFRWRGGVSLSCGPEELHYFIFQAPPDFSTRSIRVVVQIDRGACVNPAIVSTIGFVNSLEGRLLDLKVWVIKCLWQPTTASIQQWESLRWIQRFLQCWPESIRHMGSIGSMVSFTPWLLCEATGMSRFGSDLIALGRVYWVSS